MNSLVKWFYDKSATLQFWYATKKYKENVDFQFTNLISRADTSDICIKLLKGELAGIVVVYSNVRFDEAVQNITFETEYFCEDAFNSGEAAARVEECRKKLDRVSGDVFRVALKIIVDKMNATEMTLDIPAGELNPTPLEIDEEDEDGKSDTIEADPVQPRKKRAVRKKGAAVSKKVVSGNKPRKKTVSGTKKLPD